MLDPEDGGGMVPLIFGAISCAGGDMITRSTGIDGPDTGGLVNPVGDGLGNVSPIAAIDGK